MLKSSNGNSIPLKSQNLHVDVCDRTASFVFEQHFVNEEEKNPIEAFYTFPNPAEASVYSFEATLDDGSVVVADCKEKVQAKKEYNEAIKNGDTAYYMDRSDGNVFSVAIGNLAPLTGVLIKIKLVCELDNEQNVRFLRLNIPLTIADKYTPRYQYTSRNYVDSVAHPKKTTEKPYVLNVFGTVRMSNKLVGLDSKTHKVKISKMTETSCQFEMRDIEDLTKDVVVTIERNASSSSAFTQELRTAPKNSALKHCTVVNLVPDFSSLPPVNVNDCHYCILLDKSGSMQDDNKMENCKKAAERFVALIPINASFDVYAFDNHFSKFESKEENSMKRKTEASSWISTIRADGGTELIPVLREIYSNLNKRKNAVLIVLTDGDVSNTHDVLKLVKANPNVSVFSIGIGSGASIDLVKGLAVQGNGHHEMINSGSDDIGSIVSSQLKKAKDTLRKHQNDYRVEIDTMGGRSINIPGITAPLYENVDNTMFVFSEFAPAVVRFVTMNANGEESVQTIVPVTIEGETMLHRIAGVKYINELQTAERSEAPKARSTSGSRMSHMQIDSDDDDEDSAKASDSEIKRQIIEVSTDLNVLSNHTAFIGVEKRKDKVTGDMVLKEIPLQTRPRPRNEGMVLECAMVSACSMPMSGGARLVPQSMALSASYDEEECDDDMFDSLQSQPARFMKQSAQVKSSGVSSFFGGVAKGLFGSSNSYSLKESAQVTQGRRQPQPVTHKIEYTVNVPLDGVFIGTDLFSCASNGSLLDLLASLIDGFNTPLKVGDKIQLAGASLASTYGVYEIISLGSVDEPWVLQRLQ
ncbi:von Willebrand factor A domain-containing protein [Yasminevirus sp. GU-2018]|uniref:von Willebrand factor A domain-containing protein n=1 Tax=Yasminevirus sp. GU-2018 TaxID=2420051 RepID=A0A5K0UC81_9VIRU|nr:von Willebrand factor A domain-containing protein [Yasminevirus sp. GU-2018]